MSTSIEQRAATSARTSTRRAGARVPWWVASLVFGGAMLVLAAAAFAVGDGAPGRGTPLWWSLTALAHAPLLLIWCFLLGGLIERLGYFRQGRTPREAGPLPAWLPRICVQLPMFNEHEVAARAIRAAGALHWPVDRLEIQVLDDSTDPEARAIVDEACAAVAATGVRCAVVRREVRTGYKAGALEEGRHLTDAEFIAIFDADFVPPEDHLMRSIAHFYRPDGDQDRSLALVQTQWGHLNHDASALTRAQSLWVDDHHTLQMSWRSAKWGFVNFTGTAGIWRASSIEEVGGWRAASLVEDCELSFRHLFAGYRTAFVKEIVAPAELPATYTAYKAQQKRWTQGWAQVQRLHLATLLTGYHTPLPRRIHLLYHLVISWQWPVWALSTMLLPALIYLGLWFGAFGIGAGVAVYVVPPLVWLATSAILASRETLHTYPEHPRGRELARRIARVVPYAVISTGMLPHQFSAFVEGMVGPMHSEFERTPKTAAIATAESGSGAGAVRHRRHRVRVHWPYVLAESFFVAYQLTWAAVFVLADLVWPAVGAAVLAACVIGVGYFYGDHDGKVCFVVPDPLSRTRRSA